MIEIARGIRLLPIVLFATASLLALKTAAIVGGTGYVIDGGPRPARATSAPAEAPAPSRARGTAATRLAETPGDAAKRSWAQEVLGYPEITGSVPEAAPPAPAAPPAAAEGAKRGDRGPAKAPAGGPERPPAAAAAPSAAGNAPAAADGKPNAFSSERPLPSAGERAVLEQLQQRRRELEARARELEIREGLLRAAEQRIEARLAELKELEVKADAVAAKKDAAEAARLKGLVTMYENMKPKDAAKIFDKLDLRILIDVATQINPRRMSDILAAMSVEAAERLTVELATRSAEGRAPGAADLPKIEGKPRS